MDTDTWIDDVEALALERLQAPRTPKALSVIFDPACSLCRRCRDWMLTQSAYLPISFVACTSAQARTQFGDIPWLGDELIVVSDKSEIWVGPAAFLTCLWALEDWREWSFRLSGPAFAPLAERFFHAVSARRKSLASFVTHSCTDGSCGVPSPPHRVW